MKVSSKLLLTVGVGILLVLAVAAGWVQIANKTAGDSSLRLLEPQSTTAGELRKTNESSANESAISDSRQSEGGISDIGSISSGQQDGLLEGGENEASGAVLSVEESITEFPGPQEKPSPQVSMNTKNTDSEGSLHSDGNNEADAKDISFQEPVVETETDLTGDEEKTADGLSKNNRSTLGQLEPNYQAEQGGPPKTFLGQSLPGITEPSKDSLISSTVSGRIARINIKEGEFVKAGEVILELENEQESLEVERRKLISRSKVELLSAEARLATLKADFERTQRLFEKTGSISQEELMEKELEYKMAEAEYQGYSLAEKREEIEFNIAKAQLNKRLIRAPFDGIVAKIYLEIGENSSPQEPLVRVVDTKECRFTGYVSPSLGGGFAQGMSVSVSVEGDESDYIGTVEHISPVIDPSSGLQEFKVIFGNTGNPVCPGVNATVSLVQNAN